MERRAWSRKSAVCHRPPAAARLRDQEAKDERLNVDSRNALRLALRVPHPRDLPRAPMRSGVATD
jgi:hypothetical protein